MLRYLLACLLALVTTAADRPNVVLIMTDDQGYGDVGSHGNPILKTPAMDKLRSESVRLTDFHVAPKCTPTRGQLMTGLDAMRNGATRVCQGLSIVRAEHKMMPQYFADAGYATGMFGKWHLGDSYPHRPRFRGFQEVVSHRAWGITSLADYWENTYFDPMLFHNGIDKKYDGYCTDIFFDEAIKWIDKVHKDKPFFVYIPTNTPHVPEIVAEEYSKPYRGQRDGKPIPAVFYGMIANIDDNLAKLETFLAERKLKDNTILIYTTDNGTQNRGAQALYNYGMRDRKGSIHEGGHRVPFFIRWKDGKLQHGKDLNDLAIVQDLLPTLAEFCNIKVGETKLDGTSLAPLLRGEDTLPERICVTQFGPSCEKWTQTVVMSGKWRLLKDKLYNVEKDPAQKTNVAAQHPEIVQKLTAHYDAWYPAAKKEWDKTRYITIGHPASNPMMLYASDWVGDYCDNRGGLRKANGKGVYNLIVHQPGTYKFTLRRWPKESGKPLVEAYDKNEKPPKPSKNKKRKFSSTARPITKATIKIADYADSKTTAPTDTAVSFTTKLPAGKQALNTEFLEANGKVLSSALYVEVERLP